jgi:hypothetical protein
MIDRIADLQGRVQRTRGALEALADRAAELRARLGTLGGGGGGGGGAAGEAPGEGSGGNPPSAGGGDLSAAAEAALARGRAEDLASSLDRLRRVGLGGGGMGGEASGDDGRFLSDAWEIALINEEGK